MSAFVQLRPGVRTRYEFAPEKWAAAGFQDTLLRWSMKPEVVHGKENAIKAPRGLAGGDDVLGAKQLLCVATRRRNRRNLDDDVLGAQVRRSASSAVTAPTGRACGTACWRSASAAGCIGSSGSCAHRRCIRDLGSTLGSVSPVHRSGSSPMLAIAAELPLDFPRSDFLDSGQT